METMSWNTILLGYNRGYFSYYAAYWIRAYVLKFIMDNWRLVKIGTTQAQRKLFYRHHWIQLKQNELKNCLFQNFHTGDFL